VVICLEQGADLHMAQLVPLPLTVCCFSKIQIGFAFLVPAHPGSLGQRAVKRMCVCVVYFISPLGMADKYFTNSTGYGVIFTARCYASGVLAMGPCLSVCVHVCLSVFHKSEFY